jgi:multimeric flavodoxin WrbA
MGNSEILLKEALMAAEERSGAEVEIVRGAGNFS